LAERSTERQEASDAKIKIWGEVMADPGNDVIGQIFAGALAILAILIAVVVVIVPEHERVAADPYLSARIGMVVWGTAGLSALAGFVALGSLERMCGRKWPIWLILWCARLLILGSIAITIGLVVVL